MATVSTRLSPFLGALALGLIATCFFPVISDARIYWGARIDGAVYGSPNDAPWDYTIWNTFEEHTNKRVSIIHFGQPSPWEQKFSAYPLERAETRGAIPMMDMGIGLQPNTEAQVTLPELISGKYDSYLTQWAGAVAAFKRPFFFRWAWEMNGNWNSWGQEATANPALYRDAWRHLHDIAVSQGATNITWVWCPNVISTNASKVKELYPGDSYVDWTCMDGYNYGGSAWKSLYGVFSPTYNEITLKVAPTKPTMIGETGSEEAGGSKSQWIAEGLQNLPTLLPKVKAFVWFNWNIVENGVERKWPIESSSSAQSAFALGISSSYFAPNEFGSLPPLTPISPLP